MDISVKTDGYTLRETMATEEPAVQSEEPGRKDLVRHLVLCMEQEGFTIEAAGVPGYPKPPQVKRFGLRPGRFRPDVVARDGRRTVFGIAKAGEEIGEAYVPEQLESFAQISRLLVICLPEAAADGAIETLFLKEHLPHWRKMRLLRYPAEKWQEVPKAAGRKAMPG